MFSTAQTRVRALESESEGLLSQLSSLVSTPGSPSSVPEELQRSLASRAELIDELFRTAQEAPNAATAHAQAQRHREKLDEHRTSAQHLLKELKVERDRYNLLSNVRGDIEAFHQQQAQESDYYLREGGRIEQSHSLADRLLEQAQETRQDLLNQAATLQSVQRRVWHTVSTVPGINTLITKINSRQKRNSLVLATIVVLGVLFIVFV